MRFSGLTQSLEKERLAFVTPDARRGLALVQRLDSAVDRGLLLEDWPLFRSPSYGAVQISLGALKGHFSDSLSGVSTWLLPFGPSQQG